MASVDIGRLLDEPSYFVEEYLDVSNDDPDVPDGVFKYQREFLDHPSNKKLFVTGRQVGKSRTAAWMALWHAVTHPGQNVLITAKAQRQSMELFSQVKKEMRQSGQSQDDVWGVERSTRTEIEFRNGSRIIVVPVGRDGSNIRGYSADMVIVDEAAFIDDDIFTQVLSPMLAVGQNKFILLSTPFGNKGFLYEQWDKATLEDGKTNNPDTEWYAQHVPTSANPLISSEWIEEQRATMPRSQFKREILGEFLPGADKLFTREELMGCARETVERTSNRAYLGADIAGTGADSSVYISIDGDGNVFNMEERHGKKLTDAMGYVRELHHRYDYDKIVIDSTGLGEGVVDQIQEDLGSLVEGFTFTNKKKQSLYNNLRNELQSEKIRFEHVPNEREAGNRLVAQALDLGYEYTSTGKMRIKHESGGHDDFTDALALAVWAKKERSYAHSDESMQPYNMGSLR